MATIKGSTPTREAIRERLDPALEALEANVEQARRAVAAGRQAAEEFAEDAAKQVRRHPLGAVTAAAGAGALVGCLTGFALGWLARTRTSD